MCCNADMIKEDISLAHGQNKHDKSLSFRKLLLCWDDFQLDSGDSVLVAVPCCWGDFLCVGKIWLSTCIFQLLVCWKHPKDILLGCACYSNLPGYLWFVGGIPIPLCWILSTQQIQTPKGFCWSWWYLNCLPFVILTPAILVQKGKTQWPNISWWQVLMRSYALVRTINYAIGRPT